MTDRRCRTSEISGTRFSDFLDFWEIAFPHFGVSSLFLSIFSSCNPENTTKIGVSENELPSTSSRSNLFFMDCANWSLIGSELRPFICAENARN